MLASFGLHASIYATRSEQTTAAFNYHRRKDDTDVADGSSAMYDLRISGESIRWFQAAVGFSLSLKAEKLDRLIREHGFYEIDRRTTSLVSRVDDGVELTYNLSEPRNHSYVVNGVVVRNCSEYLSL